MTIINLHIREDEKKKLQTFVESRKLKSMSELMRKLIKEKIKIDCKIDNHTIGFNAQYLIEIIDIIKTEKIKILMNTQISACIISPVYKKEEDKISEDVFLIMPLRIMEN